MTDIISDLLINNKPYFVSVFVNSDVEYLSRKLPQEVLSQHVDDDVMLANEVLKFIPESKSIDTKVLQGFKSCILDYSKRETIGTDIYNEVFKFIVRGIVKQLLKD